MSSIEGHAKGAGGQKDNVSLSLIKSFIPNTLQEVRLPPSNFEEMHDKIVDTLIFQKVS